MQQGHTIQGIAEGAVMRVYLVDRDLPGITPEDLAVIQCAEIRASQELTAAGQPVRYLRSMFIPGEARCMCLFEADDEATVTAVNLVANLPFSRIVEALDLSP
jgi:muconolactone delta-isomerase